MSLKTDMLNVVDAIETYMENGETDHHFLCTTIAEDFELLEDDAFPIWLSRVVEGVLNDS